MTEPDPPEAVAAPKRAKEGRVGMPRPSSKRWGMNPEDRLRVMETCMVIPGSGWVMSFVVMMAMSVTVAIMGLSANSPALVIGAMLIAPLMTPVLGIAASLAMALGDAAMRAAAVVLAATVGAIAVSYLVAGALPGTLLTSEVMARTAPDARDLVVALAAGVAGSYATARPDVSGSLPGVAIAVALVPPLAVVGITMRAGEGDLAWGALLLYSTNLAAIVMVSTVVFVATGFVPGRHLLSVAPRVMAGSLAGLVMVGVLGILLTTRSLAIVRQAEDASSIRAAAATWLEGTFNESVVRLSGNTVFVTVTGPSDLPETADLEGRIEQILGEPADLRVTWILGQTSKAIRAAEAERARTNEEAAIITETIDDWLRSKADDGTYEVTSLNIEGSGVTIEVSSIALPPAIADLERRLFDRLGETVPVQLSWNDRSVEEGRRRIEDTLSSARFIAQDWASSRSVELESVGYDGTTLVIELTGESRPDGVALERSLRELLGPNGDLRVFFIERMPVIPAPTATPRPVPTPSATPAPMPG